jgi:hypothetical protein
MFGCVARFKVEQELRACGDASQNRDGTKRPVRSPNDYSLNSRIGTDPGPIMLIKFDSDAGSFTMDGAIAVQLLKAMGHSGTVPSAILAQDIPAALGKLKSAVAGKSEGRNADEEDSAEVQVSLAQRAFPLIDLLTRAAAKGAEVMWAKA